MTTYAITSYLCRQYTYNKGGAVALIYLYNDDGYRGRLEFHPDGAYLPEASEDTSSNRIFLRLPISRFASFVDILRNETPISLNYTSPANAFLQTSREPTGEEETLTT